MNKSIKPAAAPSTSKKIFGLSKSELKMVSGGSGVIVDPPSPPPVGKLP